MSVSPPASCFLTVKRRPSSPHSPTAGCPWRLMRRTMSLFCLPTSTIFATSTVASSDTRSPSTKPTAVDHDGVHAHILEEHHVARELLPELGLHHRRAAVLDDHRLAVELPDVGERLEEGRDVSHDLYSALKLTYSGLRSEKNTSVSPPSPGSVSAYSTSSPWTSAAGAGSTTSPAETTWWPSISRSTTNGSPGGHTWPAAWRMRPKFGSPPCRADFTSGELATARATGSTAAGRPVTTT